MNSYYLKLGFIKRAQEYGLTDKETIYLLKLADVDLLNPPAPDSWRQYLQKGLTSLDQKFNSPKIDLLNPAPWQQNLQKGLDSLGQKFHLPKLNLLR